jgi:hypothetical protein
VSALSRRRALAALAGGLAALALEACQVERLPRPSLPRVLPPPGPPRALGPPPAPAAALDPRFGVVEGFADPATMADLGAGWERVVFFWPHIQPAGADDFAGLGTSLPRAVLERELRRGVRLAGVLEFTPDWAAGRPADGQRAVPRNLDRPVDDPANYFARFVSEIVRYYAGWIDEWIVWNEPDFRPDDPGAGDSTTWLGTDQEFARLMNVGYLAAKRANPKAVVSFPATAYWVEALSTPKRDLFYDRVLGLLASDPEAEAHACYHDAVAVNLYRSPDDIYRIHGVFKDIQRRHRLDKPVWLTETNAMPSDDRRVPCSDQHADAWRTTLEEQAAFGVQAFALAAAAGYERIGFYKMVDDDACRQVAEWGLVRDDGTRRPVADALARAIHHLAGCTRARFAPLARETARWPAWPADAAAYTPNWRIYQVAIDRPGRRRVTFLWNGDADARRVRIARHGATAEAVQLSGAPHPLASDDRSWAVTLPGATAHFRLSDGVRDPDGYHYIGGAPIFVVEDEVDPSSPVVPPTLA